MLSRRLLYDTRKCHFNLSTILSVKVHGHLLRDADQVELKSWQDRLPKRFYSLYMVGHIDASKQ
jgi:hypothetical protein